MESAMPRGEVSETIPAAAAAVFELLHDYERRLRWDTLLSEAYLTDGCTRAEKGAVSVCVGRRSLGRIPLKTVYVSFDPPRVAAVKMLNSPPFFESWAASIRHEDLGRDLSRVTYTYNFTARPRWLRVLLEPVMSIVFAYETKRRLRALKEYFSTSRATT
jgi:hypothetical protein